MGIKYCLGQHGVGLQHFWVAFDGGGANRLQQPLLDLNTNILSKDEHWLKLDRHLKGLENEPHTCNPMGLCACYPSLDL